MNDLKAVATLTAVKLVFPCSGAADVGEIADRAARMIHRGGRGRLCCLAALARQNADAIAAASGADKILVIDGCAQDCAKATLEQAGLTGFRHIRVSDLGMAKNETAVTPERVRTIAQRGEGMLSG